MEHRTVLVEVEVPVVIGHLLQVSHLVVVRLLNLNSL
jgi:hypothetical protein